MGFINVDFESSARYLHEEDFKHSLVRNGLAISLDHKLMTPENRCGNKQYVALFGVFNARADSTRQSDMQSRRVGNLLPTR